MPYRKWTSRAVILVGIVVLVHDLHNPPINIGAIIVGVVLVALGVFIRFR